MLEVAWVDCPTTPTTRDKLDPTESSGHSFSTLPHAVEAASLSPSFVATSMSVEHRIKRRAGNEKRLLVRFNPLFCATVIWATFATEGIYCEWRIVSDARRPSLAEADGPKMLKQRRRHHRDAPWTWRLATTRRWLDRGLRPSHPTAQDVGSCLG
jgi:hypothetical protein